MVDTDYDPEESESVTGTPKKGREKKETPDPGLTMGTDIEDHLQQHGEQVEIELSKVRIDQEKTKGQIRRKDRGPRSSTTNTPHTRRSLQRQQYFFNRQFVVLVARVLAHGPVFCSQMAIIGVYLESTALKQFCRFRTSDGQHVWICTSGIPLARRNILTPDTPWAFRAKLAGQAQRSAQDVEPIPLPEAADNLLHCVEDHWRRNIPDTYNNLKIASVDAVQMSAFVPTAELKQPGQFICSLNVVSTLPVARGPAHDLLILRTKRINCGKIS